MITFTFTSTGGSLKWNLHGRINHIWSYMHMPRKCISNAKWFPKDGLRSRNCPADGWGDSTWSIYTPLSPEFFWLMTPFQTKMSLSLLILKKLDFCFGYQNLPSDIQSNGKHHANCANQHFNSKPFFPLLKVDTHLHSLTMIVCCLSQSCDWFNSHVLWGLVSFFMKDLITMF